MPAGEEGQKRCVSWLSVGIIIDAGIRNIVNPPWPSFRNPALLFGTLSGYYLSHVLASGVLFFWLYILKPQPVIYLLYRDAVALTRGQRQ